MRVGHRIPSKSRTEVKLVRRRLSKKWKPPMNILVKFEAGNDGPKIRPDSGGHYDALQISRHASAEAVRKAYRARALETHPDKGGDTKEFQDVTDAFMVLSNDKLRQEYDADLDKRDDKDGKYGMTISSGKSRFGSSYCQSPHPKQRPPPESNATPAAFSRMREIATQKAVELLLDALWDGIQDLEGLSSLTLCELYRLLQEQAGQQELFSQDAHIAPNGQSRGVANIMKRHDAYFVRVGFGRLICITGRVHCLETAIDWQMELVRLKNEAKARAANAPVDSNPPALTREEITRAILRMPKMQLSFACRIRLKYMNGGDGRLRTPQVRDVRVALQFIDKLLVTRAKYEKSSLRVQETMTNKLVDEVRQNIAQSKQLYDRRAQSLRSALAPIMPVAAEMTELRLQELESAFNEERANSGVAQALQSAFKWSKDSAVYAIGHLRSLPPQVLQQRLELLLSPKGTIIDRREVVDLTRGRSHSRPREKGQVTPHRSQPDRSRSRPGRSPAAPRSQSSTNRSAGRNMHRADRNRSRQSHSAASQALLGGSQHRDTETTLALCDPRNQTSQPLQRPDKPPPFRRGYRIPCMAMCLPFDIAICMVRWLTLGDLEVFQRASMCTKQLRDHAVWLRLRRYVFSERESISRQSSRGRTLRRTASNETSTQAQYLCAFFNYFSKAFVELDLQALNTQVLEDPSVILAISKLPHLGHLILPKAGWSCMRARKQLMSVLHDSVAYEFCGRALQHRPPI